MDTQFAYEPSLTDSVVDESPVFDESPKEIAPSYLGWSPTERSAVRNWWVPALLRKQVTPPIRMPRAAIRRIIASDEPDWVDEMPHAYERRALEWGSFNARALLM